MEKELLRQSGELGYFREIKFPIASMYFLNEVQVLKNIAEGLFVVKLHFNVFWGAELHCQCIHSAFKRQVEWTNTFMHM